MSRLVGLATESRSCPTTRIRRVRSADLADISSIERRAFANPWPDESFRAERAKRHSTILVAVDASGAKGHQVVGYVCYSLVEGSFEILNLAVDPAERRRGIAVSLLGEAFGELRHAGASHGTLEVRRWNVPAIALYERFGFREVGVRRNYYGAGEDALLMEVFLS